MHKSEIKFTIALDENKVPQKIEWLATDSEMDDAKPCKSMMISVWDPDEKNTMRIDLWTKDMLVDEMKQFFHQTILTMADTFDRATGETKMAGEMKDFGHYFAEQLNLVRSE